MTDRVYYRRPNGTFSGKPIETSRSAVPDTSVEEGASQPSSSNVIVRSTGPGITHVGPPVTRSIPVIRR